MPETKEVSLTISAAAGASGEKRVSVDPPGRPLRLVQTKITFPAGTEGKLRVRMRYGNMPIVPENGWATGDDSEFVSAKTWFFDAGTAPIVEYMNDDSTNAKTAYVTLTYEVMG